jgi:hypothetical protein
MFCHPRQCGDASPHFWTLAFGMSFAMSDIWRYFASPIPPPHRTGDPMRTLLVSLLVGSFATLNAQTYDCGNRPASGGSTSICYGYAISRAFGYTGMTAVNYRPTTTWISPIHFAWNPGTNFEAGDIVQWGPASVNPTSGLSGSNAHAAYVAQVSSVPNTPDGDRYMGALGRVRDEEPITSWGNVTLAEVNGEGAGETSSILMSTVNTREEGRNYVYKGYWRLKEDYKCKLTFRNSMDVGKIYFGKTAAGDYLNHSSGDFVHATYNASIPAKAELTHTINGVKWNFGYVWTKNGVNRLYSQEITASVDQNDATWTAVYSQYGTPSTHVFFELRSDNLPINSILRVNNEDKVSPTPGYTPGAVTAVLYQSLMVDRVNYTFLNWTGGSTSLTLSPTLAGTYVANYQFQYVLPPEDLNTYGSVVGEPIKISWRKVSNAYQYVDTIEVWRKVNKSGNAILLARLSPAATEYVDYDYTLTSGWTHDFVEYSVRLRYKTPAREVYSSHCWFTVFGNGEMQPEAKPDDAEVVASTAAPEQFAISAYPNPFNPSTSISLTLPVQSYVEIRVFDVMGRKVRNLLQKDLAAGMQTFTWDGLGDGGTRIASGFYILQTAVYPSDGSEAYSASTRLLLSKR